MKIGIISDTHSKVGRAKKIIDIFVQEGCEYIVHAGDIVKEEVLTYIEESGLEYVAVLGNNDRHLLEVQENYHLVKEPYYFKLGEHKIKLMHLPYYLAKEDCDIIIYGHTHAPVCEFENGTLFLNSGESCARDTGFSQACILELNEDEWIVHQYAREISALEWEIKIKTFTKSIKIKGKNE